MKRSKIFLGVTTCILAVAAVAVAKKNTKVGFYCTQPNHAGQCISDLPKVTFAVAGAHTALTLYGSQLRTLYTQQITAGGDCGSALNPTDCLIKFKYNQTNPN